MTKTQGTPIDQFSDSVGVFLNQITINLEYLVWIIGGLVAFIGFFPLRWIVLSSLLGFFMSALVALVGVHACIVKKDKVFASLGFDFSKGFGRARWIVEGKRPVAQEILRIHSGGYSAKDYELHIDKIAMRLEHPVREIRQPVATSPILEIVLKKTDLPSSVPLMSLPFEELKNGEFFFGLGNEGPVKGDLVSMIHMLVAGQTGMGKTSFLKQFMATILTRSRDSYVLLVDMKSGIDFQVFETVPTFELVTSHEMAETALDRIVALYEKRKDHLLRAKKEKWTELHPKELRESADFQGDPIGPVVVVIDELAELAKKATESSSRSDLQEKLATIARLARFTGIHLVLGTQRPDKTTINMQSKDNLPTRLCLSVPSVHASTLAVGDMSASTLGRTPGRAVLVAGGHEIVQTPFISNAAITSLMGTSAYLKDAKRPNSEAAKRRILKRPAPTGKDFEGI